MAKCFALKGWSLPVIESMQKTGRPFVVVSFPAKDFKPKNYNGNVMIYPQKRQFSKLEIPESLNNEPYFVEHTLIAPYEGQKLSADRDGFGNHFGTINFKGEDPDPMTELLKHYEEGEFYV